MPYSPLKGVLSEMTQACFQACETWVVTYNNHAWFWITKNKVRKQIKMWLRGKWSYFSCWCCVYVWRNIYFWHWILSDRLSIRRILYCWILLTLISVSREAKYLLHQSMLSKSSSSSSTTDCFRRLFSAVFLSFVVVILWKKLEYKN